MRASQLSLTSLLCCLLFRFFGYFCHLLSRSCLMSEGTALIRMWVFDQPIDLPTFVIFRDGAEMGRIVEHT